MDWSIDWLIDGLVYWSVHWLIDWCLHCGLDYSSCYGIFSRKSNRKISHLFFHLTVMSRDARKPKWRLWNSWISSKIPNATPSSAPKSLKALCSPDHPEPAKHCWLKPRPARRTCPSSPCPGRSFWRCLLELALPGYGQSLMFPSFFTQTFLFLCISRTHLSFSSA